MQALAESADPGEVELSLIDLTDASRNGEAQADDLGFCTEPPDGIEPSTYALRVGPPVLVRRLVLSSA